MEFIRFFLAFQTPKSKKAYNIMDIAIGTLTKKIHRQDRYVVSIPPNNNPMTNPMTAIALKIPNARFLSGPSSQIVDISDNADGARMAAPIPCVALAAIKNEGEGDNPPSMDDAAKMISPYINVLFLPK